MSKSVSLYSRLLKYQQTEERSNLENYLTEMLCDFLNRLDIDENREFCRYVLFEQVTPPKWSDNFFKDEPICWETQTTIEINGESRRPDLIGRQSMLPVILIESKIDSDFTEDQLKRYGQWLHEQNPDAALILLTKDIEPPEGFIPVEGSGTTNGIYYHISRRNCIRWHHIYRWMKDSFTKDKDHRLYLLAEDFLKFMEEKTMAFDLPNSADFAALQLFVNGPAGRVNNLMKQLRKKIENDYKKCGIAWDSEEKYLGENLFRIDDGRIISWAILRREIYYSWFGWGIVYPEVGVLTDCPDEIKRKLPPHPNFFFFLATNNEKVFNLIMTSDLDKRDYILNSMWSPSKHGQFVCSTAKSLQELTASDKNLFDELYDWLNYRFKEILDILK